MWRLHLINKVQATGHPLNHTEVKMLRRDCHHEEQMYEIGWTDILQASY